MMRKRPNVDFNAQNAKGNTGIMEAVIGGNANTFAAITSKFDLTNVEGKSIVPSAGYRVPEPARKAISQAIVAAMDAKPKTEVACSRIRAFGLGLAAEAWERISNARL
jgi:hypothetical protein